jgi:hypothetical protein
MILKMQKNGNVLTAAFDLSLETIKMPIYLSLVLIFKLGFYHIIFENEKPDLDFSIVNIVIVLQAKFNVITSLYAFPKN